MKAKHPIFHGSIVALPTPFQDDCIDLPRMQHLLELQIQAHSDAIVVAGSTGEGATLSNSERLALFEFCVVAAQGRIPVIANVSCSATRDAQRLAQDAQKSGVQALLVTTPAYNRPSQLGLERHFDAVAEASDLPIALYNIPSRTAVDLLPESVARLIQRHANIVAIKEASNSLPRLGELLRLSSLHVLTGDDHLILEALELGVDGVVGVVANLVPALVARMIHDFEQDAAASSAIAETLRPLIKALSCESNPAPLKHALGCLGWMRSDLRLPLVPVTPTHAQTIRAALIASDLLES